MTSSAPSIIFGTAGISAFDNNTTEQILSLLEKHNVKYLDTARLYPNSEATLGKHNAPKRFTIHTKAPGFALGALSRQNLLDGAEQSLKDLGVDSVEIYYLHNPDTKTPLEETLSAIQELYVAGKFKRFGLSNFKVEEVEKIYNIQKATGAVLPTVFQGNYNAVARHTESDLFPLLHKLGISFFAYSPIAGGFLVKSSQQLRSQTDQGRFSKENRSSAMYTHLYLKDSLLEALDEWEQIAKDAGITKAALAYRWVTYHSALKKENGDAVILGATKVAQLEETLKAIEQGPLDETTAQRVDSIWKKVEADAPLDNWNSYMSGKV